MKHIGRNTARRRGRVLSGFGLISIVGLIGVSAGCGAGGNSAKSPVVSTATTALDSNPATTGPGTSGGEPTGSGGWIGDEPDWDAGSGGATADASGAAASPDDRMEGGAEVFTASEEVPSPPAPPQTMPPADVPPDDRPSNDAPLRAGNVDDNADFAGYLQYLERIEGLGIATRPFDPAGRILLSVMKSDGLPAAGVEVMVTDVAGASVASLRTTADGSARFLPRLYGTEATGYQFGALGQTVTAAPGDTATMTVDAAQVGQPPVAIDVVFLLDATGSMDDEIGRLKTTIDSVAARVDSMETEPDVRFAMTLYRDLDDSFVTSTYDFTGNVADFRAALDKVVADGGGDYPEALDEGLAEALSTPSWRDPATTLQLVFLVADAPPQVGRQVDTTYVESITDAVGRGIKVFPIASSESDDQAEAVFRQIAQATGARFVFLSAGASGAATGPSTDIQSTDYEELALDDLIVRLISEELGALTGDAPQDPTPTDPTTPETNPEGQ